MESVRGDRRLECTHVHAAKSAEFITNIVFLHSVDSSWKVLLLSGPAF